MSNEIQTYDHELALAELQQCHEMTNALMKTKHYQKLGEVGIFAIVQKAKSLNVSLLDALNGGLYFVQGKVEMSAQMMTQLIRRAGHSIIKDPKSNDEICILHGKRKDNGDTWTESFSMKDAERAGLTKNPTWKSYPRDMMFNRTLSRLGKQLFGDVIKGCPIEKEIEEEPLLQNQHIIETPELVSDDQAQFIENMLTNHAEISNQLISLLNEKYGLNSFKELPVEHYERTCQWIERKILVEQKKEKEINQEVVISSSDEFSEEQLQRALDNKPIEDMVKECGLQKWSLEK